MGYRKLEHKPVPRHLMRNVQDTSVAGEVFIQNGVIAYFAFPCWYLDVEPPRHPVLHDTTHHDFIGHPEPRHPDRSCQIVEGHHIQGGPHDDLLELARVWPIHLREEGYTGVVVAMDDPPKGLEADGFIDEGDDWIIRVRFVAAVKDAVSERMDVPYAVFLCGESEEPKDLRPVERQIAARGVLHILPGPVHESWLQS